MYIGFAFLAGLTFGIAGAHAEGGGALVGINVGIGVFSFTMSLVMGLRSQNK